MTRFAFLGAPLFIVGYGIVRLIDGLDGSHGPGPAWTTGHLMFLVALLLFVVVLFALRRAVTAENGSGAASGLGGRRTTPASVTAAVAVAVGVVGLLAFVRTVVVDIIVGLRSADRPAMNRLYPHYDTFPGGLPAGLTSALDTVGPVLLLAALLALTIQLAAPPRRRLRWWSPVLVAAGFAVISADLNLLPLGGLLLLLALAPNARHASAGHGVDAGSTGTARTSLPWRS